MGANELRALPLWSDVDDAALDALDAAGRVRSWAPDEVLWVVGSKPARLHVVLEGEVKIVRSAAGRRHVIHRGGPGATLGEVPLFGESGYPATAIAARRTRCLVVPRAELLAIVTRHPSLAAFLLEGMARRIRFLVGRLDQRTGSDVRGRLSDYLLDRAAGSRGEWFSLGLTQGELAEELGTAREVVVRTLRTLREAGAIEAGPGARYRILDPTLLHSDRGREVPDPTLRERGPRER